jgi:hypothetical protein
MLLKSGAWVVALGSPGANFLGSEVIQVLTLAANAPASEPKMAATAVMVAGFDS